MGKRSNVEDYRTQRRGGKGLINLKTTEKTGRVVAIREVTDDDELMLVTRNGVINRQSAAEIRVIGRNTQGVRLIMLDEGDELVDVARVIDEDAAPFDDADDGLPGEGDDGPFGEGDQALLDDDEIVDPGDPAGEDEDGE
jgi:DNA gyrase subunit A